MASLGHLLNRAASQCSACVLVSLLGMQAREQHGDETRRLVLLWCVLQSQIEETVWWIVPAIEGCLDARPESGRCALVALSTTKRQGTPHIVSAARASVYDLCCCLLRLLLLLLLLSPLLLLLLLRWKAHDTFSSLGIIVALTDPESTTRFCPHCLQLPSTPLPPCRLSRRPTPYATNQPPPLAGLFRWPTVPWPRDGRTRKKVRL